MQNISSNSFNILGSKHFHLLQWSFDMVLFSEKKCMYLAIMNQIFNRHSMHLSVKKMPQRIV